MKTTHIDRYEFTKEEIENAVLKFLEEKEIDIDGANLEWDIDHDEDTGLNEIIKLTIIL